MSTPRTTCAAPGCSKPVHGSPWSSLCDRHATLQYRNGSPQARSLRNSALQQHRERIARALSKYQNSSAVKHAVMLADDLLSFRPRHGFGVEERLQAQMLRLRGEGVTARELLQRVTEVWALQAFDQRFDSERELDHAMARAVLKLRPMRTWRPAGPLLRHLGREIREELGRFCAGLCMRLDADDEVRVQARKAFETGWTMDGEES
jgi:hypothetical protein